MDVKDVWDLKYILILPPRSTAVDEANRDISFHSSFATGNINSIAFNIYKNHKQYYSVPKLLTR